MIEYENLFVLNKIFGEEFQRNLNDVLNSGQFVLGNQGKDFEKQYAEYCGSRFCSGVANGSDALTLALKAFSFESQSEVIVPSNTYVATILAVINANLKPVLVEPDVSTYTIDPLLLERSITKRTVAVIPVHLYGKCCDMDGVLRVAKKFNLKIIEDCAQSHGARFREKKSGTFGDFGAFSFYPTKNLGALGDGGCLITDQEDLAQRIKLLRNYGSDKKYYNAEIGQNSRLDEIQAAFLLTKLPYLDKINDRKKRLAAIYNIGLKQDFIKPIIHNDYDDVFHIYAVRHPWRDQLKEYLLKNSIKTEIHYPVPPHRQKALSGLFGGDSFPISEEIHASILSLPISFIHSEDDVHHVVEVMNKF